MKQLRLQPDDGYDRFFATCLPKVLTLGRRLTGSQAEAEDVAVEALARAFAHWGQVRGLAYREAWVMRVATNLVIARTRRPSPLRGRPGASPDVADAVVLRVALVAALRGLSRRQREALVLRYLVDLPEDDVAAAMGVSVGTVRTHVHRGLSALRASLGSELPKGGDLDFQTS